ncbi:Putative phosphoserine phosphatase 2 [Mycolicibacterium vanbaalenii]|uniref:Phosphoserine phosphatase 2 n=1 Tax=Mycolicibacterium vanbaalenii TaxID=110539 RepID=A0A5S9PNT4_MYCVN|nr:histidine phosphatase family protein [Mycolicibacterium vanbaalenii]CAA0105957.1 Putative phosphoserine phosphatase 2 [Mycolicibacterium vanbaalenii]
MRLLLVRHAETDSNVAGLIDTGIPGPGLTVVGYRQSHALVETFSGERIESIYASTHARTALTAQPLARVRGITVEVDSGLGEISAGTLEMRGDSGAVAEYLAVLEAWVQGRLSRRMPGGENGHEFLARYDSALHRIRAAGCGVVAVFSHGGAIRTWSLIRVRGAAGVLDVNRDVGNTDAIVITHEDLGWRVGGMHEAQNASCARVDPLQDFE